ncbi:MAG TPA: hypothetical protein VGO48_04400 [Conexibacter sp.]|jgi:hypothetical protein|nr:hypothetical protein [Conexibacter sp.]
MRRRAGLAACLAAVTLLLGAAIGQAAPTLSITVGPDPVETITTQLGVTGTADSTSNDVQLKVKPAGGPACGANPAADEGSRYIFSSTHAGPFAQSTNWTPTAAGSYLACAWIVDNTQDGSPVIATASVTVAVRQPHLVLSILAPTLVSPGRTFQIATTAQAEARRSVYVSVVPDTGRGCPANFAAADAVSDETTVVYGWDVTGGPLTDTRNVTLQTARRYIVCAYFHNESSSTPPQATATASLTVASPCRVPRHAAGASPRTVKRRIVALGCAVGQIRHKHSRRYARGTVIGLNPASGTKHAPGAAVQITVSDGPPPRRHRARRADGA